MSKSAKTSSHFEGQKFASFRRKHELFLGPFLAVTKFSKIAHRFCWVKLVLPQVDENEKNADNTQTDTSPLEMLGLDY